MKTPELAELNTAEMEAISGGLSRGGSRPRLGGLIILLLLALLLRGRPNCGASGRRSKRPRPQLIFGQLSAKTPGGSKSEEFACRHTNNDFRVPARFRPERVDPYVNYIRAKLLPV